MRKLLSVGALVAAGIVVSAPVRATTVPWTHPSYFQFGDATTLNFHLLDKLGVIAEAPKVPSGKTTWIRMFTGSGDASNDFSGVPTIAINFPDGVKFNSGKQGNVWDQDSHSEDEFNFYNTEKAETKNPWFGYDFPTSKLWYGLEFSGAGAVNKYMTGQNLLTFIQALDPGSTTPLFVFDQNQNTNLDIWLKGRVILVNNPGANLSGKSALEIDAALAAWLGNGTAVAYSMYDKDGVFDETLQNPTDDAFVWAPGNFTHPLYPAYPVQNNGSGSVADWGAFIPALNLNDYKNWGVLVEMQFKHQNDGFEEFYIAGGVAIPLPSSLWMGLGMLLGLGAYRIYRTRKSNA